MVYHNHCRIGALLYKYIALLIALLATATSGCGGGGGRPVAHVEGTLVTSFGATVNSSAASVTLEGTETATGPDSTGYFTLSAPPGIYNLIAVWSDPVAGIRLSGKRQVNLVADQTLSVGSFEMTDIRLDEGWARYRQDKYSQAETFFQDYLDFVRAGQADISSASAYSGLGWTRGQGLNKPENGRIDFNEALEGRPGNTDALVGLAGCELSRMNSGGVFHFSEGLNAINSAIDRPGDYSSAPVHDDISEPDLLAFRVLMNFLIGNTQEARSEAQEIETLVRNQGNPASEDLIEVILEFTK